MHGLHYIIFDVKDLSRSEIMNDIKNLWKGIVYPVFLHDFAPVKTRLNFLKKGFIY